MNVNNEIILYQPDSTVKLEVRIENETVWLTQQQIADLFGVKQPAISKHLRNIFESKELMESSVHSILEYTAADGKVYKTKFYNLDAILSVGYLYPFHQQGFTTRRSSSWFPICANRIEGLQKSTWSFSYHWQYGLSYRCFIQRFGQTIDCFFQNGSDVGGWIDRPFGEVRVGMRFA